MKRASWQFLLLFCNAFVALTFAKPTEVKRETVTVIHFDDSVKEENGKGVELDEASQLHMLTKPHAVNKTEKETKIHREETINNNGAHKGIRIHGNSFVENDTDQTFLEYSQGLLEQNGVNYSFPFGVSCSTCTALVDSVRKIWRKHGQTRALAKHFAITLCIALRLQHPRVCSGLVQEFEKEFYYVFRNKRFPSNAICSTVFEKRCGGENLLDRPWNVTFPNTQKPPIEKPTRPKPGSPVIKVLHLTDLHIDLQYKENTSTVCGEPLCCREENGAGDSGYWGAYGCDIPLRTLDSALKHIKQRNDDISYIIMTGDIAPHDIWLENKSTLIEVMQKAFENIKKYFPQKKVFVAVGNHDSHPINSFPPSSLHPNHSVQWLFDSFAHMWSAWLSDTSLKTVRKGGYFTTLVSPGFRIVSINNNYCNKLNWWLMLNTTDPAGELQWLIQVLQTAEDKGEKVHIIAHIPTGINLCYKYWSWNYYKIINRYENTVTAQFSGHTHQDHFEIFFDLKDHTRPHSVMYVAPSLTTYMAYQPAYRIYEVEGNYKHSSRRVVDHKTYILNLAKSNKDHKAYWELEYRAKKAYNMEGLLPTDWNNLVARMQKHNGLFQKFYKFKHRNPTLGSCDELCKKREICGLKSARSHDNIFCEATADHVVF